MQTNADTNRNRLVVIFALVTLVTATYAGAMMFNYARAFPAMNNLQVRISAFDWNLITPNPTDTELRVNTLTFRIDNTENYVLTLKYFKASLDVVFPSQNTQVHQGSILYVGVGKPVDPGNPVEINVPSFTAPYKAAQLAMESNDAEFDFQVDLFFQTFLDHVGELGATHLCQANTGPVDCQQETLNISTKPGPTVGGGGA